MSSEDPPRLKHSKDAPPELVRALEALHKGADEHARLARVRAKLEPVMNAPPSAWKVKVNVSGTAIKLTVGVLALSGPAVWWLQRSEPRPEPQHWPPPSAAEAPASAAPTWLRDTTPAAPVLKEQEPVQRGSARRPHGKSGRTRSAPSGASELAQAQPAAANAPVVPNAPAPVQAPAPVSEPHASQAEAAKPTSPEPKLAPRPQPTAAIASPAPPSEAKLLLDARMAMAAEPARALRSLEEHERRFPSGRLIPERELLAIEALRKLGRASEAKAREDRFRARFPDSFHLQRLTR